MFRDLVDSSISLVGKSFVLPTVHCFVVACPLSELRPFPATCNFILLHPFEFVEMAGSKDELACVYAALVLLDDDVAITVIYLVTRLCCICLCSSMSCVGMAIGNFMFEPFMLTYDLQLSM